MQKKDWRELATRASAEQDPKKLLEIIQELNELLEIRERRERNLRKEISGRRILLVDDEDNIRLTLSLILRERAFAVTPAGSVLDAKKDSERAGFRCAPLRSQHRSRRRRLRSASGNAERYTLLPTLSQITEYVSDLVESFKPFLG